jgi:hypothetical protein
MCRSEGNIARMPTSAAHHVLIHEYDFPVVHVLATFDGQSAIFFGTALSLSGNALDRTELASIRLDAQVAPHLAARNLF